MDLLVNLYDMKIKMNREKMEQTGVVIKRALSPDKGAVLDFMRTHYTKEWADETEHAFSGTPISCYIAVRDKEIIGIAAYDATAKGYFGPIAIKPGEKGSGIGPVLMSDTLNAMKEAGYGYAVIGWVDEAVGFYEKTINAAVIEHSEPKNTIYQNLRTL